MYPPIRDDADVRALEQTPLAELLPAANAFEAVRQSAERHPENIALKFLVPGDIDAPAAEISYGRFIAACYRTANMFHDLGLRPGEVVSFLLPLCPQAYYTIIGGEAAGIVNAVNPLLEDWQIAKILKAANTKILVVPSPALSTEIWDKVAAVRDELPELSAILTVGGGGEGGGVRAFDELLGQYPDDHLVSGREIQPDDIAAYFHTGGTTGTPKLAPHTHHMQVSQIWSTGAALDFRSDDILSVGLPLFHIGGSIVCGLVPLAHGTTLCVLSPAGYRDPAVVRDMWLIVHKHRISLLGAVPTVLGAMLNAQPGNADISSVRYAVTGGAALPYEVGRALAELLGKPVLEGYGMTETTSYVTMPPRDGEMALGSVGLVMPHCQVKTVQLDEAGEIARDCAVDEIGVVVMRGACVTPGYIQEQYNEGTLLADGWLNSGDLGRFDAEGRLWLTGRAKDLIIRGGHNIDPAVIEETLHGHPAVELAAAVGKPDSYAGELPIAYVQLKPGAEADAEELQAFAREHIPERAANPVNLFLLDVMPVTAVGKIFKPALRWDAIQRVFGELLAPLAEEAGIAVEVEVSADDLHGTLASVALSGGEQDEAVTAKVEGILAPFAVHHEVTWR
ncbi:MAG: acyl-CoA synthetase [Alphaproteobacteria bacterium]|jgi:fatty-acyl-CoA synthase|nr:acyl-CoA synthetase [Alphaproteobacteria bacterium]MDP6813408.1 acyl-CoA synthetase [Alphaproteobacteria bacterium]